MTRSSCYLLALAIAPVFAAPPRPAVRNVVVDHYRPLASDQQKLAGILSARLGAMREGYLERVGAKVLLSSLRNERDNRDQRPSVGIEAGTFLAAAANAYEYSRHPNLKAAMDQIVREFLAEQLPDSSTGKYPNGPRWSSADIWIQGSDLLGLLAYYRVTGDESTLEASKKIGNLLLVALGKPFGSHVESRSALFEPFVYLYRYTGDTRYFDLCKSLASLWLESKQTQTDPTYDNLSNLVGLIELYRITGDASYFRSALTAWSAIRNRLTVTGGFDSRNDEGRAATENNETAEICKTASWVELTLDLLRITGESQYGDELERTIYNQLFAAEDARTGNIFASVPINGSKKPAAITDACAPAEAEGISLIPSAVWGRYGKGIAVILYTAGRATFQLRRRGSVQLYSEATYPETGSILLHVEPSHPMQFPIRLRVPDWTSKFTADIGGSHLFGKPGEFLSITREWKRGDTLRIAINVTVRTIDGAPQYTDRLAIRRGPQILALSTTLNPRINNLAAAGVLSTDVLRLGTPPVESRFPAEWAGNQAYTVPGEYEGQPHELVLVPFADAIVYRVWIRKPGVRSDATDY